MMLRDVDNRKAQGKNKLRISKNQIHGYVKLAYQSAESFFQNFVFLIYEIEETIHGKHQLSEVRDAK
jgi:hypothetical protein